MRDRHLQHFYAAIPNLATDAAQRVGTLLSDECDLALKRENHNSRRALLALVTFLLIICTWAFHTKLMTGSLAASANRSLEADQFHRKEFGMRFNSQIGVAAGVAAMSIAANACAQTAVEWRVADGGNGHWYALMQRGSMIGWHEAVQQSAALGGYLATPTSAAENAFIFDLVPSELMLPGPWLGGFQDHSSPAYSEPRDGWSWVTGEPFVWTNWNGLAPNNDFCGGLPEDFLHFFNPMGEWNDLSELRESCVAPLRTFIIEWSADCNNDGIVDYGQILAGYLSDANANNIPDCCEGSASCDPCPADIVHDGFVNAIDLAAVLNNWGSAGGKINADANDDGLVDAQDLAIVLSAWGACE